MEITTRKEAKSLGLKKYFTGVPCNRRGHLAERLVSNTKCVECNTADHAEWKARNSEHVAAYQKDYAAQNSTAVTVHKKRYKARNRATVLESGKRYYAKNKELILEKARLHKQKNYPQIAERMRRYTRENRGLMAALAAKYRASKLRATPSWADLDAIRKIYETANAVGMEVDHEIPLQGRTVCGLHVEMNLRIIPRHENRRKSAKFDPERFAL
jgi:choline dehydrogenase-like flavoprotein